MSLLKMSPVMPFNNVNNIALGQDISPSLFITFSGSPLLFKEMGGVEKLGWKLGASRLYSLHHVQKQALIVVVHEGDCCSSAPEPSCSTNLQVKI